MSTIIKSIISNSFYSGLIRVFVIAVTLTLIASGCRTPMQAAREKRLKETMTKKMEAIKAEAAAKKSRFEKLLDKANRDIGTVDFTAMRMAAINEPGYDPYSKNDASIKAMYDFLDFKNTKALLAKSKEALGKDYLDIETHFVTSSAYEIEGKGEEAGFHLDFARKLLESIQASGDGQSAASAYKVISVNEEYALIKYLGLKPIDQVTAEENGVMYDIISVIDPISGEQDKLYFDIEIPYKWLSKKFLLK